jgi:hypothetical protein
MDPSEDQAPLVIFLAIVFALLFTAVFAHYFSSGKTRQPLRRIALWAAAVVSTIVAFFASVGFGIPVLQDFRNPNVGFREAMIGTAIVWFICLAAWFVAIRCVVHALRRDAPRPTHS